MTLASVVQAGGTVTFASAASLTLGRKTIPVYEIYKVGEPPRWLDGLEDDEPFLLYFSFYAVHTPLQAREEDAAPFRTRAARLPPLGAGATEPESGRSTTRLRQDHPVYAGMIAAVDRSLEGVHLQLPCGAGNPEVVLGAVRTAVASLSAVTDEVSVDESLR